MLCLDNPSPSPFWTLKVQPKHFRFALVRTRTPSITLMSGIGFQTFPPSLSLMTSRSTKRTHSPAPLVAVSTLNIPRRPSSFKGYLQDPKNKKEKNNMNNNTNKNHTKAPTPKREREKEETRESKSNARSNDSHVPRSIHGLRTVTTCLFALQLTLAIANTSLYPRFIRDTTTETQWSTMLEWSTPWTELEGNHVIFTLPTAAIRLHADCTTHTKVNQMLEFWDSLVVNHRKLINRGPAPRKERVCADVQISAGYMHSGYPVMMHLDQAFGARDGAPVVMDAALLKQKGAWGLFHEFGHNQQDAAWTFEGTGEVTVNFFTLYSMDTLIGIDPIWHPWLQKHLQKAMQYLKECEAESAREELFASVWQHKPGVALVTFALLQHRYGWEAFHQFFAEYDKMERKPNHTTDQIAVFIHTFSRVVNKDLRPYFARWGWPMPTMEQEEQLSIGFQGLEECTSGDVASLFRPLPAA
eukprot:m.267342 g.267342  ORF g.267342 m.267342 type:complete len:470 (+) comp15635_c0_seq4:1402-2811(+)